LRDKATESHKSENGERINLGRLLREENASAGLGGRNNFLYENAIEGGNQTLCHLLLLLSAITSIID